MSYQSEISRDHPTCFLFLIDQSGSMSNEMDSGVAKSDFVADVLNKTIYTLITNCTKSDGVRNYFDIGIVGYGGAGVSLGLDWLNREPVIGISMLAENPRRVEIRKRKVADGVGGLVEQSVKFPVWFDAVGSGETPMRKALTKTAEVLVDWCDTHPHSYPPTLLHITDAESTDGDPEVIADELKQISTNDGEVLAFNLHVSTSAASPIFFPSDESGLPDQFARLLFRMSSTFPPHLVTAAQAKGYSVSPSSRGFIYKGGAEAIVDFFDIGTRPRLVAEW